MRASHIQSELIEAIDAGAPAFGHAIGALKGSLADAKPADTTSFVRALVSYLIAPRLAAFDPADYFGETIDPQFELELITPNGAPFPAAIGMTNWREYRTVRLSWSDHSVAVNDRVISLAAPDAREDLIHWIAWAVAEFFGGEDE